MEETMVIRPRFGGFDSRRRFLQVASGALVAAGAGRAGAQAFPSRPIRMVVPLPPGGATDFMARALAQRVGPALGQQIVVENKAGANQMIGTMDIVRAPADGHALLFCQSSVLINTLVAPNPQFDFARDLEPVSHAVDSFAYYVVPVSIPPRNFREFVEWARGQSSLSYGTAGQGSGSHVYGELINRRTGLKMAHVPYKGEAPILPDVIAGRVQSAFISGLTALQLEKEGKLRIIASIGPGRSPATPNVPTIGDQGMVDLDGWYGVFAPRGVPQPIIERIALEFDKALREPDIREKALSAALGPVGGTPRDFERVIVRTREGWAKVVKETGVRVD
jgi:tripartite-type tricarboxylate transporter receptor subunit TctC